jgi:hypothetical protein
MSNSLDVFTFPDRFHAIRFGLGVRRCDDLSKMQPDELEAQSNITIEHNRKVRDDDLREILNATIVKVEGHRQWVVSAPLNSGFGLWFLDVNTGVAKLWQP